MEEMNADLPEELQKDPRNLLQWPTRFQVSDIVNKEGPKNKQDVYARLKGKNRKATLSFDSCVFAHVPYYAGVLYFPSEPDEPPLVVCFKKDISSQEDMAKIAVDILVEVSEFVDVTNVVLDGLFRQIQAFTLFPSPSSTGPNFQDLLPEDFPHPLPFLLSDLPHLLTLALTHTKDNGGLALSKDVQEVNEICSEIRKKAAVLSIGSRYPTYSPTRFFHIVLELVFINKHKVAIAQYYVKFVYYIFGFICF
jgi:hypothetical protein